MPPDSPSCPPPSNLNSVPPVQALLTIRIIWAALLLGQIFFLAAVIFLLSQNTAPPAQPNPAFFIVAVVMLLTASPVMFLIRGRIHRRARRPDATLPAGPYATGNLIFWAGCESVSFFSLIAIILNHSLLPTLPVAAVAFALQVLTFPKRFRPHPPRRPLPPQLTPPSPPPTDT